MRHWLLAAGVYNLLWGSLTVLVPSWLFVLTGLEQPRYPFLWQCVGMIVGVYGIGYLAAATNPLRHWPIVLVGLLGKVFGPLGYVGGLIRGDVPVEFGVTLPTNDLLWWIPFTMILLAARREALASPSSASPHPLPATSSKNSSGVAASWLAPLFIVAAMSTSLAEEVLPRTPLWKTTPPIGDHTNDDSATPVDENAFITVHLPEQPNGAAIVICPGGGYGGLVVDGEGHGIASWLCSHGIAGIVLEYRLPRGRTEVPLLDAARAVRTVRHHAQDWQIDPARVGIIGFSAGGHLAATASTLFDTGDAAAVDPVAHQSSRPDFAILVYPVIDMGESAHAGSRSNLFGTHLDDDELVRRFSPHLQVTAVSPPAFLAHAVDDTVVPIAHSELFYDAYREHGLPALLLRLPDGGHGLNGYKGPSWDAWQSGAITWLRERGLVPAA
ncbi:MAG: alpha/beta hydrolase [Pirellulales bacterium]